MMSDGKAHSFGYEVISDLYPLAQASFKLAELGRGDELSSAEVRSGLKSWSLGANLAELQVGRCEVRSLADARSEAWQRGGADWSGSFIFLLFLQLAAVAASG
jgi:hypothetical protein